MRLRDAILAETLPLPPIPSELMYQFVVAGNGLFIRAEDSRIEAMVPVAFAHVHGLESVESYAYARLKVPRVPPKFLWAIAKSARAHLPNEAMYQFVWEQSEGWHCIRPNGTASAASLHYDDRAGAVIDLHSHGTQSAFFSETDDDDEQGLRFYAVVGQVERDWPQIAVRVGVYGHTWNVPQTTVFEGGPYVQVDPEVEQVLAERDDEE